MNFCLIYKQTFWIWTRGCGVFSLGSYWWLMSRLLDFGVDLVNTYVDLYNMIQ